MRDSIPANRVAGFTLIEALIAVAIVAIVAVAIVGTIQSEKKWNAFRAAHACKVVGQMDGSTSTGVGPNMGGSGGVSVVLVSNPGKTGWLCDDGVTYWRNK